VAEQDRVRDQAASDRDLAAEDHDRAAELRDRAAELRDRAAELRDRAAEGRATHAADDRVKAADDREDEARDRATTLQNRVDSGVSQNMAEPIRIMIADDDKGVGAVLVELIHSQPDLAFAGFAYDTPSAIELAKLEQPDVAIVDIRMPGGGGVDATIGIRQSSPTTQVIAFSADSNKTIKTAMIAAGASGYLTKGTAIDSILKTLRAAARS